MKQYNGSEFYTVKENFDPRANSPYACNYARDPTDGWGIFTKSELAERTPFDQDYYMNYGAGVAEGFAGVPKQKLVKYLGYLLLIVGIAFAVYSLYKCSRKDKGGRRRPGKSSRASRY